MGLGSTMKERAAAVEKILAEVKVYSGVNKQELNNAVSQFADMPSIGGLSVGNAIYMAGSIPASMDSFTADLLGHEAIHSVQAAAHGGTTAFLNAYIPELRANQYSAANKFEYAAYAFGGDAQAAGITLPFTQILKSQGTWWR
jgi:hypothetical protein